MDWLTLPIAIVLGAGMVSLSFLVWGRSFGQWTAQLVQVEKTLKRLTPENSVLNAASFVYDDEHRIPPSKEA